VRIKEEPDKEAMQGLDDETLALVDAVRKVKNDFYCEADKDEINKLIGRCAKGCHVERRKAQDNACSKAPEP